MVMTRDALGHKPRIGERLAARGDDEARPRAAGKGEVARRRAARHLEIDDALGDAVAAHDLAQHGA